MSRSTSVRALAVLLVLAAGCGGDREFVHPKTLTEWRPQRRVAAAAAPADDEETFRATAPDRGVAKARALAQPTEVRLSNGIRVVMLERHDFPSISAMLVLDRGAAAAAPGVATLYSESMLGTSAEYKSDEAFSYLNFVGGFVDNHTWHDGIALEVTALSPLFVSALSRVGPMFTAPSLESDEVEVERTKLAAARVRTGDAPAWVAHDALYGAVFPPPHPYGTPISGEASRLGANTAGAKDRVAALATDAAVKAFRDGQLTAEHVSVACVGDFKPAIVQRALETTLGKLPKRAAAAVAPFPVRAAKSGGKVVVIDRPGAAQSNVAIGWPGPRASERDLVTLDVLASATAGELSTRLNITVRKELGASYGVQMDAIGLRDAGLIRITAAIDTARTIDALRGLFAELGRLRTEPLTPSELGAARLRTYHQLERGSNAGLARYLAHALVEGLPPAHVVTHNARVDVVTAESVRVAAERYLAPDEVRVVVVGDASRIAEGLRTLGLGDVTVTTAK